MTPRMKKIGVVGGMSWASTITYYRVLNEEIIRLTNGARCGSIQVISFDSSEIEKLIEHNQWKALAQRISDASLTLASSGCEIIVVASNTAHIAFDHFPNLLHASTIHIIDAIACRIDKLQTDRVGFLGTSAMLTALNSGRLSRRLGFSLDTPAISTWMELDRMIFDRLCRGSILQEDRAQLVAIVEVMKRRGATQIVLGCTEIGLLFSRDEKAQMCLLDTAELHASAAAHRALDISSAGPAVARMLESDQSYGQTGGG